MVFNSLTIQKFLRTPYVACLHKRMFEKAPVFWLLSLHPFFSAWTIATFQTYDKVLFFLFLWSHFQLLLKEKISPDIVNNHDATPLHKTRSAEIVRVNNWERTLALSWLYLVN